MKPTKKDRVIEEISLGSFGLTTEEIEGFFDFYKDTWEETPTKKKKIIVINSRGTKK